MNSVSSHQRNEPSCTENQSPAAGSQLPQVFLPRLTGTIRDPLTYMESAYNVCVFLFLKNSFLSPSNVFWFPEPENNKKQQQLKC